MNNKYKFFQFLALSFLMTINLYPPYAFAQTNALSNNLGALLSDVKIDSLNVYPIVPDCQSIVIQRNAAENPSLNATYKKLCKFRTIVDANGNRLQYAYPEIEWRQVHTFNLKNVEGADGENFVDRMESNSFRQKI